MIRIEKQEVPDFLSSSIVDLAIEKMKDFYASKNRSQKRYEWPFNKEIDRELKKYLHTIFHGKCGYCELNIESHEKGTIDRYRPNNGVRDKNQYHQDLYWWLAFEWTNLIYCCKECNQYKANYFPISGKRAMNRESDKSIEIPLLLNPYEDDPKEHITINQDCHFLGITIEGQQTIELLRLNRENLIVEREKVKNTIESIVLRYIDLEKDSKLSVNDFTILDGYLSENIDFYEPHTFFGQQYIYSQSKRMHFKQVFEFFFPENIIETTRGRHGYNINDSSLITSDYFPIEYVHIKNFKSIDDLRIDFKEDELNKKSWLFLLGENGVGKSTILQAIALGLKLNKSLIDENKVRSLIKKRKQFSEITIKEKNSENTLYTKLVRKTGYVEQLGNFNSYLIGYGSLRLSVDEIEIDSPRDTSNISYENLFNTTKALNDVTKWLRSIHKNDIAFFNRIAISIKQLLPHDRTDTELAIKGSKILLDRSETEFEELSDGYKSTITLALDIMMKLSDAQSDMDKMSGIVLIDELGNQLHPRWQMRIVKQLRTVFPNINFIISTHHPLCLRGAENEEILLLRNIKGKVVKTTQLPDPATLRVDQLLASEFFGLSSLVDPEIEAKFNRYYELLAKNESVTPLERNEIGELKNELRNKQQLGSSLREELLYFVIDKLLAERITYDKKPLNRDELKAETIRRVKEVWKTLNLETYD